MITWLDGFVIAVATVLALISACRQKDICLWSLSAGLILMLVKHIHAWALLVLGSYSFPEIALLMSWISSFGLLIAVASTAYLLKMHFSNIMLEGIAESRASASSIEPSA